MPDLSRDRLIEAFSYEPNEGLLYWKISSGRAKAGRRAGCFKRDGYGYVVLDGTLIPIHRAIWIIENDKIPSGHYIDHIDRNPKNNHISNLRLATHAENMRNSSVRKGSKSRANGVHFCNTMNRWVARITKDRKMINLGSFKTVEEATWARQKAELSMFGEFSALRSASEQSADIEKIEALKGPERIVAWAYYGDPENGRWSKDSEIGVTYIRADLFPFTDGVKEQAEARK